MAVDAKRTAVVLIEYQNDFTSEGGALHGAVAEVMEQTGMLENTRRLVEVRDRDARRDQLLGLEITQEGGGERDKLAPRASRHTHPPRRTPMDVEPNKTAVVLIEYQNDFTSEGGALHGAVADVMAQTGMLENTGRLVAAARAAGATIVHAPITFAPGYGELSEHPYGILKGVVDSTAFVKGGWGAEIVDQLAPHEGDVVVEGKRGLDTFATTNLDFILRARGITTIALGGFLTNCCVESTMRSGYEKGYEVITLADCVAATSSEEHENAIRFDYPMFSVVMTSQALADELHSAAVAG